MSLRLYLISLFFLAGSAFAQTPVDKLYQLKSSPIPVIDVAKLPSSHLALKMSFNEAVILNPTDLLKFRDKKIQKIELVYTAYRQVLSFDQPLLNIKRFEALEKLIPGVLSDTSIQWKIWMQTAAITEEQARPYFHGFIISYSDKIIDKKKEEISYLKKTLNNDSLGKDTVINVRRPFYKKKRVFTGMYLPNMEWKRKRGILYSEKGLWNRKKQFVTKYDTLYRVEQVHRFLVSETAWKILKQMEDSTVLRVLSRNPWENILFVCDVTGSMSPYSAQLLVWNKMNFNAGRAKYFTFFNDGDDMPDSKKVIGRTGGIYHVAANSPLEIEETAEKAMKNGNGGDIPENYMEAMISASDHFPHAGEIVLIADNWSSIKDIALLPKFNKPVHVILCGSEIGVNLQFLKLAQKTGGSVHTFEKDILNMGALKEGDQISLGHQTFQFIKGRFKVMKQG